MVVHRVAGVRPASASAATPASATITMRATSPMSRPHALKCADAKMLMVGNSITRSSGTLTDADAERQGDGGIQPRVDRGGRSARRDQGIREPPAPRPRPRIAYGERENGRCVEQFERPGGQPLSTSSVPSVPAAPRYLGFKMIAGIEFYRQQANITLKNASASRYSGEPSCCFPGRPLASCFQVQTAAPSDPARSETTKPFEHIEGLGPPRRPAPVAALKSSRSELIASGAREDCVDRIENDRVCR